MVLLNSLISGHLLYLLSLTTLLKSCMNFSIFLPLCSILFNSATFIDFLSPPLNSFLISVKNSPTDSNSNSPASNSSNIFSFQISANPPWTCNNIYWICSSTITPANLFFIYNLYLIINPKTFNKILSNSCSFVTFILAVTAPAPTPLPPTYTINTAICSCNCLMMAE